MQIEKHPMTSNDIEVQVHVIQVIQKSRTRTFPAATDR